MYSINYTNGDNCSPIHEKRMTEVQYKCDDGFFRLLDVAETSTCKYKMVIGTNLLCSSSHKRKLNIKNYIIDNIKCSILQN